ncbi:MAG: hypothetical protein JXA97_00900 [Anaerolineales bacterium]|nr:hypothetical protein [Anaerolineales bacterium]
MKVLSQWFERLSPGRVVLAAIVAFFLFMIFVLPGQTALTEETASGAGSPDTTFFYSRQDLYAMADSYGEDGRAAYIRARFRFDLIFPLVYGAFLITSISWLAKRAFDAGSGWRLLNLIPLAGVSFDFLENIAASVVMARFPLPTPGLDSLAPVFSISKWLPLGVAFGLLLFLPGRLWLRRAGRKA